MLTKQKSSPISPTQAGTGNAGDSQEHLALWEATKVNGYSLEFSSILFGSAEPMLHTNVCPSPLMTWHSTRPLTFIRVSVLAIVASGWEYSSRLNPSFSRCFLISLVVN